MCTSEGCRSGRRDAGASAGFSVIELILGLTLTLCLAMAVAPFWLSLRNIGLREGDQTVRLLQGRVAVARLERDLRLASAAGSPFPLSAPVLEASASQVVFLERPAIDATPVLVEWEIANGALMRRRGAVPAARPVVFSHNLFVDHKTMLEGIEAGSAFTYVVRGVRADPSVSAVDEAGVDEVVLELRTVADGATGPLPVMAVGWVGR
jgi:hypothetical protein